MAAVRITLHERTRPTDGPARSSGLGAGLKISNEPKRKNVGARRSTTAHGSSIGWPSYMGSRTAYTQGLAELALNSTWRLGKTAARERQMGARTLDAL